MIGGRKFEIPYNFDKNLITALNILNFKENIDCIYTVPYWEDYPTTNRQGPVNVFDKPTYEEYVSHMNYIDETFPNTLQLLLQRKDRVVDKDFIFKYLKLGFTRFCVATLEQAKIIKEICPDLEVIGSIMMKLSRQDIEEHLEEYKKYFDGFVLFFPFNRNFEEIKLLPAGFKYILLVNCFCNINCSGDFHWYADSSTLPKLCPNSKYIKNIDGSLCFNIPWEESSFIRPTDIYLFEPYIQVFKIQGREFLSREIISHLSLYLFYGKNLTSFLGPIEITEDLYNGQK